MKVGITGAAGMIGRKLVEALLARGEIMGPDRTAKRIDKLVAMDVVPPDPAFEDDPRLEVVTGEVSDPATVARVVDGADSVFHLAAVVSGAAEADFDLGMRVNLDGTRLVLEACRQGGRKPRLVYASSVAAFGGDMPDVIRDDTPPMPQTSYGTQKVIGEHLVNDYSRKGFVNGRGLRLPTIVVRPGRPNKAASTWASSILREPLAGYEAVCPVGEDTAMWILSPRRVTQAFLHAHDLPRDTWGAYRVVNLPGITVTVAEALEALREVGGSNAAGRVRFEPDPFIQKIVAGWPTYFEPARGRAMGFQADTDLREVLQVFVDDDLPKQYAYYG